MNQRPQSVRNMKQEIVVRKHFHRLKTGTPHRENCSESDIKAFLANRETIYCSHVAARVTDEACREFRKTLARVKDGSEAYFDAGPLQHCQNCPYRRGAPPVTLADVQTKVLALILVEREWAERKARGLA